MDKPTNEQIEAARTLPTAALEHVIRERKEAARKARPVLLEPMFAVEVTTPENFLGDVIGDINSRRGQVQNMEDRHGDRVVNALVPLSEMFGYVGDLRSKTSGQASYSMEFDSYAEVPQNIADEIIKKVRGE